ncbi:hypothetical protein T484DRAFT_1825348, partial [Baffinella frigidus]
GKIDRREDRGGGGLERGDRRDRDQGEEKGGRRDRRGTEPDRGKEKGGEKGGRRDRRSRSRSRDRDSRRDARDSSLQGGGERGGGRSRERGRIGEGGGVGGAGDHLDREKGEGEGGGRDRRGAEPGRSNGYDNAERLERSGVPWGGGQPNARQLTGTIKNCRVVGELARILRDQKGALNHIHVSAAWVCLARIGGGQGGGEVGLVVAVLQRRTRDVIDQMGGREIANS